MPSAGSARRRPGGAVEVVPGDDDIGAAGMLDLAGGQRDPQALLHQRPCHQSPSCTAMGPSWSGRGGADLASASRARATARSPTATQSVARKASMWSWDWLLVGRAAGGRRAPPARRWPRRLSSAAARSPAQYCIRDSQRRSFRGPTGRPATGAARPPPTRRSGPPGTNRARRRTPPATRQAQPGRTAPGDRAPADSGAVLTVGAASAASRPAAGP